jgi:class 3 adenylate cyclase
MFADIAGFTAWSSIREPCQVFTLLETVYGVFDSIARKKKVFKVETIGDCYVAVTGLPVPQANHAIIMAKFAFECTTKMNEKSRELEVSLGPGTGNLMMRVGLHSGAVTAGVLRGEKSRFQLFGDTVNTASRMESTGLPSRIQCSEATANLLITAGKSQWLSKREGFVQVKGKGQMATYWLNPGPASTINTSTSGDTHEVMLHPDDTSDPKHELTSTEKPVPKELGEEELGRLVDFNVDLLQKLLSKIVASRGKANEVVDFRQIHIAKPMKNPRDEVTDVVSIAPFEPAAAQMSLDCTEIDPIVCEQLKDYVKTIASIYMDIPFHNFYHASHVTMSASKLLNLINSVDEHGISGQVGGKNGSDSTLHAATYGIASDPLTQFAVVFSTIIHDANHPGVSNGQLIEEATGMAAAYDNKSIAEQNSVDLAWDLLMEPSYKELQNCIFADAAGYKRFRNVVVNSVIATDFFDKELNDLRDARWLKAFHPEDFNGEKEDEMFSLMNAKATLVIENIIQASAVAHTMQHWYVYEDWAEKDFAEMYAAYKSGRANKDPSEGLYEGELWFYDNYSIPLARKLEECGVFGSSSGEYLNYALENRSEWEAKGESLVQTWLSKYS